MLVKLRNFTNLSLQFYKEEEKRVSRSSLGGRIDQLTNEPDLGSKQK